MTVRKVNLLHCDLDESLDEAGFEHAAAAIGSRIGAQRIGAAIYEAVAERPIWPYHYHYSSEEWLYVISGAPVLREAAGRRALGAGDLVCFPPDHRGAHTVFGPGRFMILSTKESPGPWVAVYPDSDKVSVSPGRHEPTSLNALLFPRSTAVDYWHGEGTAGAGAPESVQREPSNAPSLPVVNVLTSPVDGTGASVGPALAGMSATLIELDQGEGSLPYRYQYGREEWVLILSGRPTLRHPGGEDGLQTGDVVAFPEGPGGAHRLVNAGRDVMRAIFFSTTGLPATVHYPDGGLWVLHNGPGRDDVTLHAAGRP